MNKRIANLFNIIGPFLGLLFVFALFSFFGPAEFYQLYNIKTILQQTVIVGIGALGMTMVIISGGIDLSAGSLIALGSVVTATILRAYGGAETGMLLPLAAALAAVGVCAFCGFLNGAMISSLRMVPFIVTLGMMQIARGAAKGIARQETVNAPATWLNDLMIVEPTARSLVSVAPALWVMLALLMVMVVVLRYTVFGRYIFAIGSNQATARLCGINVAWQRVWIFTAAGAMTGVASVMQFSNLSLGDPTVAVGKELDIIAAVVIGGGSLSGGEGSALGSMIGAIIMVTLRNGCQMAGIPNYIQDIVIGVVIIAAVGVDRLKHARRA